MYQYELTFQKELSIKNKDYTIGERGKLGGWFCLAVIVYRSELNPKLKFEALN